MMTVVKFGGTALGDALKFSDAIRRIEKNKFDCVVVSAPGSPKITDMLIESYEQWLKCGNCGRAFAEVSLRLRAIGKAVGVNIDRQLADIEKNVNSGAGYDYTVSRGEYLTAYIMAKALGYNFVDAVDCIKFGMEGKIDFNSVIAHSEKIKIPCVVPGFYGKMPNGEIRLLPRGGSDISGAVIAAAINAEYVKFTDVDGFWDGYGGVMDTVDYEQASLLCRFGASVVRYEAIEFLRAKGISMRICSAFCDKQGTLIGCQPFYGKAMSSKEMYFGTLKSDEIKEILDGGLSIPFSATWLDKVTVLVDDCGFSPSALKRILPLSLKKVKAAAIIGQCSNYLYDTGAGKIALI